MKHFLISISIITVLAINGFAQDTEKTFKAELDEFRGNMQKQMPKEAWDYGEKLGNDMTARFMLNALHKKELSSANKARNCKKSGLRHGLKLKNYWAIVFISNCLSKSSKIGAIVSEI